MLLQHIRGLQRNEGNGMCGENKIKLNTKEINSGNI